MNWNSHEFIWIDWVIIVVGILAVTWAVWRSIQKDKRLQQGASSEDYCLVKGNPGISSVQLSSLPISVRNTL